MPTESRHFRRRLLFLAAACLWNAPLLPAAEEVSSGEARAIFQRRILPIFQAKAPSSCAECHLSGVDLKNYLDSSADKTFAKLRRAGLIDVERPDESKILKFIAREPGKPSLVSEKVRRQELAAFREWIRAAAKDKSLLDVPYEKLPPGPTLPPEVIRHARADRVLASFVENVWSEAGRCAACHSPDRNEEQVKKHGEQVSWITLGDPQATLDHLVSAGLIDADEPEQSLILLKPTNKVEHGGGQKMLVGDRTYKQFRRFVDDYAAVVAGRYKNAADLPSKSDEVSWVSDVWFKIVDIPPELDKLHLRVDLYRWEETGQGGWSPRRAATGERAVFGQGKLWQQHLTLVARRDTSEAERIVARPALAEGRYLAKIYLDRRRKLENDYRAELDESDLVGTAETNSRWPAGYNAMTIVSFPAKGASFPAKGVSPPAQSDSPPAEEKR